MKDVILKPGIFPPSQTSYILQEKSILLFCSLWEYNPNGLLGSFLFPQTHQLQCLEKHGEIFRSCQHIFFCCMRTYRCQMLRASEAASSMFPHKEHSHFLLHPKETDGKHLAHLNTKGSVFDIPPGNWSSIEDLNKILVFSTTFRHKMDGELAELCQCFFFRSRGVHSVLLSTMHGRTYNSSSNSSGGRDIRLSRFLTWSTSKPPKL